MTNRDETFLPGLGLEKRVIFCVIPDNDTTYNFLVTMLYSQLFDQLFRLADSEAKYRGALPVHVRLMMDEFANVALPQNFKNILSVCRSRNISCDIILQNIAQLKGLFKDEWEGVLGNCDTMIYLGGNEYGTFEYLSKILGKETERTKSQSIGKGSRGSSSESHQAAGRELQTPDEIRRLDNSKALVLMRSQDPVIDDKYDILRHPNVRFTPDGGGEPYVMPYDYAGNMMQSVTTEELAAMRSGKISTEIVNRFELIDMEENENEQENIQQEQPQPAAEVGGTEENQENLLGGSNDSGDVHGDGDARFCRRSADHHQ
jgi:type IV secretion system protein VirD4